MTGCFRTALHGRRERWKAFLSSRTPGDLLVLVNRTSRQPGFSNVLSARLQDEGLAGLLKGGRIEEVSTEFVRSLKENQPEFYRIEDDQVPCAVVYCGIGSITAAMTGREPRIDSTTTWLDAKLSWDEIACLRFDPDNPWLQLALRANRQLRREWDGDFLPLPFLHRSPLDAACGIRGSRIFVSGEGVKPLHLHQPGVRKRFPRKKM